MERLTGTIYLVGAGPGDAGLLTLRGAELLADADAVLYDRLVSDEILEMAADAHKVYVGRAVGDDAAHQQETNSLMLEYAQKFERIVRLKGGDPGIFGRGGEEAEFLRDNGISYEIVPGITSGTGSAAYSGIPLTHREHASSVAFVTGHDDPAKRRDAVRWDALAGAVDTIVIMMGLSGIGRISRELRRGGMTDSTPVAVIENGTTTRHRMITGNLGNIESLVSESGMRPPANIIIGDVVLLSEKLSWRR